MASAGGATTGGGDAGNVGGAGGIDIGDNGSRSNGIGDKKGGEAVDGVHGVHMIAGWRRRQKR